jgi:hypothetical protein
VLSAHVHVHGSDIGTLFRITEEEDVILHEGDLAPASPTSRWATSTAARASAG